MFGPPKMPYYTGKHYMLYAAFILDVLDELLYISNFQLCLGPD